VTLHGAVNPKGTATISAFWYGTKSPNHHTSVRAAGAGDGALAVEVQVGKLEPGTRYVYRLVAHSKGGTVGGAIRSFTTARATPVATTGPAGAITPTTASLQGTIDTHGRTGRYGFQYGPTTSYGASTPAAAIGPSAKAVRVVSPVDKLVPATRYHYRLVVTLADGSTAYGRDRSFVSGRVPNGLLIEAHPSRVRYGHGVSVGGALGGSGNSGVQISVQADPFPFGGSWTTVASGRTDARGRYLIGVSPLLINSRLRAVAATNPAVTSLPVTVRVKVRATMHLSTSHPRRGARVRFHGTVTPGQPGATVLIQRRRHGHYRTVARTRQHASRSGRSSYSRRQRIRHSGRDRVVARTADGAHVMGNSRARTIHVHRAHRRHHR
jgi:hypothetical protein